MNPKELPELRKRLIEHHSGTPEDQKNALVANILEAFENPQNWPMLDDDRIALLKNLYSRAVNIRKTERA